MTNQLPYLPSYKNVPKLFSSIATAKVPDNFTQSFLSQTLGLKASGDRPFIPLLRTLGFIDSSGRPTPSYRELKNPSRARGAIATAVRRAYKPLFDANEQAHGLNSESLRGLIAQVAGTDAEMSKRIAYTFSALAKLGDFTADRTRTEEEELVEEYAPTPLADPEKATAERRPPAGGGLRPEFHYNFQIHLPANGAEETYLNIFNALRKVFQ